MTSTEVNTEINTQISPDTKAPPAAQQDIALQREVEQSLRQDSYTKASKINVHVAAGVVTLAGTVDNYLTRQAAGRRAGQVRGVHAVVNDIKVRPHPTSDSVSAQEDDLDAHLVHAVWQALQHDGAIPLARLQVTASQGFVFLKGAVEQSAQRAAAERVVRQLAKAQGMEGVRIAGVINWITATPDDIKRRIADALGSLSGGAERTIEVEVQGQTAFLKGTVQTVADRSKAEQCALSAPGIRFVRNDLAIASSRRSKR